MIERLGDHQIESDDSYYDPCEDCVHGETPCLELPCRLCLHCDGMSAVDLREEDRGDEIQRSGSRIAGAGSY